MNGFTIVKTTKFGLETYVLYYGNTYVCEAHSEKGIRTAYLKWMNKINERSFGLAA